ncbi:protocatechuate 3,4-dioxygenase subunit alpha [Yoonia sp. 2307UL14-13]|uniref:protocatechuate 3,4-dioxygenase subunit alpha n=1 Tax=Yoonia sp. 2307UL14-13 TaxID=3126506 RepID=UPI0030B7B45E
MNNRLPLTPSQTAGPYLHIGLTPDHAGLGLEKQSALGHVDAGDITVTGTIRDGKGEPVKDALIEVWNGADQWLRAVADPNTGRFTFRATRPIGPAPHLALWIIARGINSGLHTRMYFPSESVDDDAALAALPESRRKTLIAKQREDMFHFDIHLQGDAETVFFDV